MSFVLTFERKFDGIGYCLSRSITDYQQEIYRPLTKK